MRDPRIPTALVLLMALSTVSQAAERSIDIEHSTVRIHVGKAGLFSPAAHEHWVTAPLARGSLDGSQPARVAFAFDARKLRVEPDTGLSAEKQAEVQRTMQQQVLESEKYPEISFRSTLVEKTGSDTWTVTGILALHGRSNPVSAAVRKVQDKYVGRCRIKQTTFGIHPVSAGGGLVKVKDELEIEFSVIPVSTASAHSAFGEFTREPLRVPH